MGLLGWAVAALAVMLSYNALIAYAFSRGLGVKIGLKIPFATFFFEANGREGGRQSGDKLRRR